MPWYIEISGTSLSEEAKRACKLNNIYQIDQLVNHYKEDKEFIKLKEINEDIQNELSVFLEKLVGFFSDILQEDSQENEVEESEIKSEEVVKQVIENLSIEELLKRSLINTRLYNICEANNLIDLSQIFQEFSTKNTFRHFRNSGESNDKIIRDLMDNYEIIGFKIQEPDNEQLDINEWGKNTFEEYLKKLDPREYSLSLGKLETLFKLNEEKLFLFLCDFYIKLRNTRGKKTEQIKSLIQRYFDQREDLNVKQKRFYKIILKADGYPFSIDTFELWSAFNESVQSLIFFLFESYDRIKTRDRIYIKNFLCFFEGFKPVSYDDLLKLIHREIDDKIPSSTMKVHINRAREKVEEIFAAITDILGPVYLLDNLGLDKGNNYFLLKYEKIEELNAEITTPLSKEFYRYLLRVLLKDQYMDIRQKKDIRVLLYDKALYFVNAKYFDALADVVEELKDQYDRRRVEEIEFKISEFTYQGGSDAIREVFLEYVSVEYDDIAVKEEIIILPQNAVYKKKVKDYLVELFEKEQKPLEYNELIRLFDEKFPGKRSSYRSLRDALLEHEEFTHFGDRRGKYFLSAWENDYVTGPLKELIIDYFKEIKNHDHAYNVYHAIKGKKEGITYKAVNAILGSFTFFINEKGGVYYYQDYPPKESNPYTKSIHGLNYIVEKIPREELIQHRKATIEKLVQKYPEYSRVQMEYAIDLRLGWLDV